MNRTNIDFLDYSWNPLCMRCTPISEGCEHCWHIRRAKMLTRNTKMTLDARLGYSGSCPVLMRDRLNDPLKVKKSARIGTQFMGDLFHEDIGWNDQYKIFEIMLTAYWHSFFILTKRPQIMAKKLEDVYFHLQRNYNHQTIPVENIKIGISAENQPRLDERLHYLVNLQAVVRFLSLEPLLGPIDLPFKNETITPIIDWVIIGGLSLPGGKIVPPNPRWIDNIVVQCGLAGIPVFIKDNAQYLPERREFPK